MALNNKKKMRNKSNFITAMLLQLCTILSGLVIPRLIISSFGSEVNGLISSITQFLSFISLLEGGLGAVILAGLYLPIEQENKIAISRIIAACRKFFREIAVIFVVYTIALMVFYPLLFDIQFSWGYVSLLILILSITTLMQYLFSITYRLLLQADQKIYIVNIVSAVTIFTNMVATAIVIKTFPEIHLVKLISSAIFLIQPVFYNTYVKKHYELTKIDIVSKDVLPNRWSGFSQNLAHFINMNTDIIIITLFCNFKEVSVYSVHMLALNALRATIVSVAGSYQSALGKYIASGDKNKLHNAFSEFENVVWCISVILFSACIILINPFVKIYTVGVADVNYYRPIFSIIMVLAQLIYCVREPYRLLILAAGKFKETNFGAIMEALINLVVSVTLIHFWGIEGVAAGTFIAILYRLIYFSKFLKKNVICLKTSTFFRKILFLAVCVVVNVIMYHYINLPVLSFWGFIMWGCVFVAFETLLVVGLGICKIAPINIVKIFQALRAHERR